MRRFFGAAIVVAIALGVAEAPRAGLFQPLPTEIGAHCGAEGSMKGASTVLGLSRSRVPLHAPTDGVITGWEINVRANQPSLEQRLQVFRSIGSGTFLAVGESRAELVRSGENNAFKTRIPVEAGDRFALRGTTRTFVCDPEFATSALYEGTTEIGQTYQFEVRPRLAVPVRAIFELDEDRDGYGDETQDNCDFDPATQNGCPAVGLRIEEVAVRERSILLGVKADVKGGITAFSEIAIFENDPEFGAGFVTYGTMRKKELSPDGTTRLALPLRKQVRDRLETLAPGRHLRGRITILTTSVDGRDAIRSLTVRLHGRREA
jgi:hypothetical protein